MIVVRLEYCKSCGECCFADCKGEDGKCHELIKPDVCESYPIVELSGNYFIGICKGISENKVPINELEKIVKRLNLGERDFMVKSEGLYFASRSE